jgi:hypothetical protein
MSSNNTTTIIIDFSTIKIDQWCFKCNITEFYYLLSLIFTIFGFIEFIGNVFTYLHLENRFILVFLFYLPINFLLMAIIDRFACTFSFTSPIRRINQLKIVSIIHDWYCYYYKLSFFNLWSYSLWSSIGILVYIRTSDYHKYIVYHFELGWCNQ